MREIKFRVWNNNTNKYEYTELDYYFVIDQRIKNYEYEQYTGLKDKNGKEIYEGDIVEYVTHYYGNENRHRKVVEWGEWDSDDFGEPHNLGYFNLSEGMEVIGNIHENGDLLGGKK